MIVVDCESGYSCQQQDKMSWEVVYVIKRVRQMFSNIVSKIVWSVGWRVVKLKFVLNVMLEPKIDLYIVAIPLKPWRGVVSHDIPQRRGCILI